MSATSWTDGPTTSLGTAHGHTLYVTRDGAWSAAVDGDLLGTYAKREEAKAAAEARARDLPEVR